MERVCPLFIKALIIVSPELIPYIEKETPEKYKYVIDDIFKKITIYDNKTTNTTYKKIDGGKYLVTIEIDSRKYHLDGNGNETKVSLSDYIDIGILGKNGHELYLEKRKINNQNMTFEIEVNEKPEKAGIDIYNRLIDRNVKNNLKKLSLAK